MHLRFYVLREDLLAYYVNEISERLVSVGEGDGWQVGGMTVCASSVAYLTLVICRILRQLSTASCLSRKQLTWKRRTPSTDYSAPRCSENCHLLEDLEFEKLRLGSSVRTP